MERAGRYEYEDMLLWVAKAFETNEALLRSYQERYQYILVDEFQDTNGAQFHLLNLLLDFWEIPNIFIVGDDDQSIYEFQGARLENLREFHRKYRTGLETIVLEENYRSTQAILDPAGRLIARNTLRVLNLFEEPLEKKLRAGDPGPGPGGREGPEPGVGRKPASTKWRTSFFRSKPSSAAAYRLPISPLFMHATVRRTG